MPKSAKAPAYQWYPKDYRTDAAVIAMSLEEEGAYRNLMDVEWLEMGLPNHPDQLWRFARCTSRDHFESLWPSMREKFIERDGRLYHPRLDEERKKQRKNKKARQLAAKKRWENEHSKRDANALQMQSSSSSSAIATPVVLQTERQPPLVIVPESPAQPSEQRTPNGHPIRRVFEHYRQGFLAKVGAEPNFNRGKDASIIARSLKKRGEAETLALIDELFRISDPFISQAGYTFGVFESCLNKLIASRQTRRKPVPTKPCEYNHTPPCADPHECLRRYRREQVEAVS